MSSVITKGSHPSHIPSLDGLRALSFFLVFFAHAGVEQIPGGFGVTVFFFLSGFLITTLLRVEEDRTGNVNLKHFYLRRVLRILPPFYLVLGGALFTGWLESTKQPIHLDPNATLSQMLHFSNYWIAFRGWNGILPGTGVYWSLAVEEHFYLLFPALYIALRHKGLGGPQKARTLLVVCGLILLWRCVLVFGLNAPSDRTFLCSDTRCDSILYGCILALWRNPALESDWDETHTAFWRNVLFPASLLVLLTTFFVRGTVFRETLRYTLQGLALIPVFVVTIRCPKWAPFRPLNWRLARFIGTLSYTAYLVHHVILELVRRHWVASRVMQGALALALTIAFAWIMFLLVERPCARLRKRLSV